MADTPTPEVAAGAGPEGLGISIDPATWVEPKQSFPGIVEESKYDWATEKLWEPMRQRIARDNNLTIEAVDAALIAANPAKVAKLPVWDLRIRRFDAKYQLPDGSQADVIVYGGFPLLHWSGRDNAFIGLNPNFGKEAFVSAAWSQLVGQIEPPTVLVGRMFMFDHWTAKRFGKFSARNVAIPMQVLPPTYQYTGDVTIIQVRDRGDTEPATAGETPAAATGVNNGLLSEPDALAQIIATVLPGKNVSNSAAIIASMTPEQRVPSLLMGIADGSLIKRLTEESKIAVGADGTISLPA